MTETPMTKEQVLAAIAADRARLDRALAALGDNVDTTPVTPDGWTAKDILAHFIHWAGQIAWGMGAPLEPPAYVASASGRPTEDEWNAMAAEHYRKQSFDQVLARLNETMDALVQQVAQRSDEQLLATDTIPWDPGRPLWRQIGGETFVHGPGHLDDIEAAAARR